METQSCTSRETCGLETKFWVFFEEGLEVMMIVGPAGRDESCVGGRECGGR